MVHTYANMLAVHSRRCLCPRSVGTLYRPSQSSHLDLVALDTVAPRCSELLSWLPPKTNYPREGRHVMYNLILIDLIAMLM
jgi:hypothetical protein